ncbi:putative disease resistance protein [Senna tora]|uniref:Putative disease resistance protein n=1 Tax=Senna tora TaxID=362788 RepID=A0A834W6K1_9FABA|nr:putative disease resistance protein [Senna tora]
MSVTELAGVIWDAAKCLCDFSAKHSAFISHLDDNFQSLTDRWTQLQNLCQDVNTRLQLAETKSHMRRTKEVHVWLQTVNSMEEVVEDIRQRVAKLIHVTCLRKLCSTNCCSTYNLGREITETLDRVNELMSRGQKFGNDVTIAYELPPEVVDEMLVPKTVGMDLMVKQVKDSIEEEDVSMIGLYGMGGVGKTTLLKKINNEFAKGTHDFTLVIWVDVSKDFDTDKVMDEIRKKCGIDDIHWKNRSRNERVQQIYRVMKKKKFILFLDDIWKVLELEKLGVPPLEEQTNINKSKILFTTRFENVCDQMQARKFKVKCLTEEEAFDLFRMKVGEETLNSDPNIPSLARELMQECRGLPLALITIGRAMAGRRNPQSWSHAIKELRSFPSDVLGVEEEVFFTLQFSYDRLPTTKLKKCFLYCALYPEDIRINVHHVIRLWIVEGFFGEVVSFRNAYDEGEDIVESLKLACLLEHAGYPFVRMHDVVRHMALWLLRDQDRNKNRILVQGEALGFSPTNYSQKWEFAERISLVYSKASHWRVPICPKLVTLIMQDNASIQDFANVKFMSSLKILSLINSSVRELPSEIGQLNCLEYLELNNLSCIENKFPMEMKNLERLQVLLVCNVGFGLESIPLEVVSSFKRLKVFYYTKSNSIETETPSQNMTINHSCEKLFLEELELLPLEDVSLSLETIDGVTKLLTSTKLQHSVTGMDLKQYWNSSINIPSLMPSMRNMQHLESITLVGLQDNLEEESSINHNFIFHKLRYVSISDCQYITHLTWLKNAPLLYALTIEKCNLIEQVIKETDHEDMDRTFSNLTHVRFRNLPKLNSISKKALFFKMLQVINIRDCSSLKKLPFHSNTAKNLKKIWGETQWWHNLEWEDSATKDTFHSKFIELN